MFFTSTRNKHSDSPWCEPITPCNSRIHMGIKFNPRMRTGMDHIPLCIWGLCVMLSLYAYGVDGHADQVVRCLYGRSRATLDATGRCHRASIRPVLPRRMPWSSISA
jgi:hypothetical protein